MSTESIQVIATVVTLSLVALGVAFGALQLRQETLARRLQGISALFADIWPAGAATAAYSISSLPPSFEGEELTELQRGQVLSLNSHFGRVGYLLWQGLVKEEEILLYPPFGTLVVDLWARSEPYLRNTAVGSSNLANIGFWWEYLAARAQSYWEKHGGRHIKDTLAFTPRAEAMYRILDEAHAQRPGRMTAAPTEA